MGSTANLLTLISKYAELTIIEKNRETISIVWIGIISEAKAPDAVPVTHGV